MHAEWYLWLQGKIRTSSSGSNISVQIQQELSKSLSLLLISLLDLTGCCAAAVCGFVISQLFDSKLPQLAYLPIHSVQEFSPVRHLLTSVNCLHPCTSS